MSRNADKVNDIKKFVSESEEWDGHSNHDVARVARVTVSVEELDGSVGSMSLTGIEVARLCQSIMFQTTAHVLGGMLRACLAPGRRANPSEKVLYCRDGDGFAVSEQGRWSDELDESDKTFRRMTAVEFANYAADLDWSTIKRGTMKGKDKKK